MLLREVCLLQGCLAVQVDECSNPDPRFDILRVEIDGLLELPGAFGNLSVF